MSHLYLDEDDDLKEVPPTRKGGKKKRKAENEAGAEEEEKVEIVPKVKKSKKAADDVVPAPPTIDLEATPLPPAAIKAKAVPPKPASGLYKFLVKFDQPTCFRQITTVLSNFVENIKFTFVNTESFQGVQFNTFANKSKVCYASGSLGMTVQEIEKNEKQVDVCLNMVDFANCMKTLANKSVTQIYKDLEEDGIVIESVDSETDKVTCFKLNEIDIDDEEVVMLDDALFSVHLEFPLAELDRICKTATTFGSKLITFEILKKGETDLYVCLSVAGRVTLTEYFHATMGASQTIRVANTAIVPGMFTDDGAEPAAASEKPRISATKKFFKEYKCVLKNTFSIPNITQFTKSLEKSRVTIHFAADMCMCFEYVMTNNSLLNSEKDRIRYVVCAANEGEDK